MMSHHFHSFEEEDLKQRADLNHHHSRVPLQDAKTTTTSTSLSQRQDLDHHHIHHQSIYYHHNHHRYQNIHYHHGPAAATWSSTPTVSSR